MRESIYPFARQRNVILFSLLALAAAAWGVLLWQSSQADRMSGGLTMGMGAPLFLAMWVAMMVAMMFPTAAPMVLMFSKVHLGKRQRGQPYVPTWIFVSAYIVVWIGFGILAYLVAVVVEAVAAGSMGIMDIGPRVGGGVFVLAGLYQLSPLKRACLTKCRTTLAFILGSWRDGYAGSFRMGLEHGLSCLGCCWLLFVILFPLGIMNIAVMALVTALIFAEKSMPVGERVSQVAAVALIVYGVATVVSPGGLLAMPGPGGM